MVKYALVRHPDDKLELGVNRDVESQIISIEEIHEPNCLEEKIVVGIVFTLAFVAVIVAFGT